MMPVGSAAASPQAAIAQCPNNCTRCCLRRKDSAPQVAGWKARSTHRRLLAGWPAVDYCPELFWSDGPLQLIGHRGTLGKDWRCPEPIVELVRRRSIQDIAESA